MKEVPVGGINLVHTQTSRDNAIRFKKSRVIPKYYQYVIDKN